MNAEAGGRNSEPTCIRSAMDELCGWGGTARAARKQLLSLVCSCHVRAMVGARLRTAGECEAGQ
eukprot:11660412-Prorocentrum_lima.AAC.1